jgi:oxygen-dependent protoporphyrinogen oxidase
VNTPKTLILGGGISGLLAAWYLHSRGIEAEVWEASEVPGGWARTLDWPGPAGEPGFLERGPQVLRVGRGSPLNRLLQDLGLELHPLGPKGPRWLGKEGRRQPSPASFRGLLRAPGLGITERLRMLAEPFIPSGDGAEESLGDFFTRRLGQGFANELLPALVAGVLAAPPERLGLEALPRLRRLEARGGLLLGGLKSGFEQSCLPMGGVGALAQALSAKLGRVRVRQPARALEPLPGGRWRIHGHGLAVEAEAVVLALPTRTSADLMKALAPESAALLAAVPSLNLSIWHSRHAPVKGWERGLGLLIHPPEGHGLLGAVSFALDDPRGVPGLLQLRTYVGGAFPVDPRLKTWPGVFSELRGWLPELGEALQVREEDSPGAFSLLAPGHSARVAQVLRALPPNLHWLGAARFGSGIPDLAQGIEAWARAFRKEA